MFKVNFGVSGNLDAINLIFAFEFQFFLKCRLSLGKEESFRVRFQISWDLICCWLLNLSLKVFF